MGSTSVHLPEELIERLDGLARSDVKMLQESLEEWLETLQSSRRNRTAEPF